MPTNKSARISADQFLKKYPKPVVMQFQPEHFKVFEDSGGLRKWENLVINRVGISPKLAKALRAQTSENGGTCCESGDTNDCDVD